MVDGVDWIPADLYAELLIFKGVLAGIAVILLVIHMKRKMLIVETRGQRGRYMLLLAFVLLSATATFEQLEQLEFLEQSDVGYRHLAAIVINAAVIWVTIQSIVDDRKTHHEH